MRAARGAGERAGERLLRVGLIVLQERELTICASALRVSLHHLEQYRFTGIDQLFQRDAVGCSPCAAASRRVPPAEHGRTRRGADPCRCRSP